MTVILESTDKIITFVTPDGKEIQCRIWEGKTVNGVDCHAFIPRIVCNNSVDAAEFDRDLQNVKPASPEMRFYPLRLIL